MKHSVQCTLSFLVATAGALGCTFEQMDGVETVGETGDAIMGGTLLTTETWGSPTYGCSSTLLRDRWLLTVKHAACTPTAGASVRLLNGQTTTFQSVINHPSSDIALVRLSAALVPSGSAATRGPYPLYKGSEAQLLNKDLYCQGWGGDGQLRSGNLKVNVVGTGVPGFCDGTARCFQTLPGSPQSIEPGDSGGGCMVQATPVDGNRVVGVIAGGTASQNFHESVPWFRDWANGIIGSAPTFGTLTGYERADLYSTVLYRNGNHLIELALGTTGGWIRSDLMTHIGAVDASSNPTAFVRWDGYSSVAYRGTNGHIYELYLQHGGGWNKRDLTPNLVKLAVGNPTSYGRADRVGIVLYRNTDNDVIELSLSPGATNWVPNNMTAIYSRPKAASDPVGYVRADGVSAFVYRDVDNRIQEFSLPINGSWSTRQFTGVPTPQGQPRPFTRSDGVSAIVYRNSSSNSNQNNRIRVIELPSLVVRDATADSGGAKPATDPFGYVRADGKSVIVYKTSDNHIREITWTGTQWSSPETLTNTPNAPLANGTGLSAFVRADRISAVVYRTSPDNHVHMLQRPHSASAWLHVDLTEQVGGDI